MIMISVDWDFFVPEDPMHDMAHQESLLFLTVLWANRYGLRDIIKTTGEEECFWEIIRSHFKFHSGIVPLVSDSHVHAYKAAQGCEGVVLFDAHHDCWEHADPDSRSIYCHTWLRAWLEEVPTRWAYWVWPEHAKCIGAPELPEDMADRVIPVMWEDFKKDMSLIPRHETVGSVHVCRSGCWTPPWLDSAFIDFFSEGFSPDDFEVEGSGPWNPLACRWTEEEERQAKAQHEQVRAFCDSVANRPK